MTWPEACVRIVANICGAACMAFVIWTIFHCLTRSR